MNYIKSWKTVLSFVCSHCKFPVESFVAGRTIFEAMKSMGKIGNNAPEHGPETQETLQTPQKPSAEAGSKSSSRAGKRGASKGSEAETPDTVIKSRELPKKQRPDIAKSLNFSFEGAAAEQGPETRYFVPCCTVFLSVSLSVFVSLPPLSFSLSLPLYVCVCMLMLNLLICLPVQCAENCC